MRKFPLIPRASHFIFPISFLFLLLALGAAPARHEARGKIPAELLQAFERQGETNYLIVFADAVDLSGASALTDKTAKRQFVYDRLREQAQRTQTAARELLAREGISFRAHYLLNSIEAQSNLNVAQQLAALPEVEHLSPIVPIRANLPQPTTRPTDQQTNRPSAIEWGVSRVRAPSVWSAYNVRGEGVVVGVADTGTQWDHPALKPHYRGWNGIAATHSYNWRDAIHDGPGGMCSNDSAVPCDGWGPFSHGTHVAGIMVGDDGAGNQIGVAPSAQWIACRNMDNNGDGTIARYTECFEFMLAPYPQNGNLLTDGRPDLAADIVNNSWTCTAGEGCDPTMLNALRGEVQKLNAAGILVVAAAGNYGGACSSIYEPPAIHAETFTIGSIDISDGIASDSSRGPVSADGSNRRKPDVSAPGVNVRSSVRGNGYRYASGTSMASPHTSGVAALLWSAAPSLSGNITQTVSIIESSADPRATSQGCGGDSSSAVPNNVYGYGIVSALAAVQAALPNRYYFPFFAR